MSDMSDAEQVCLSANIGPDRLMLLVEAPDFATDEEGASLIGCLGHETLLRLFLSTVLDKTGTLSAESSACILDSFADTDLTALMVAAGSGAYEGPEDAMGVMMVSFLVTLSCLNEEEFQAAGPVLGMAPEDQQGLQCLLDKLEPEGVAALMQPDSGPPLALFSAALVCNLQLSGEPDPTPTPDLSVYAPHENQGLVVSLPYPKQWTLTPSDVPVEWLLLVGDEGARA